ncbi:Chromosome complete related, putative [Babesia ovata]|uniref:Chromosome complete related, putative n=1 Tax=Babesia ovata TaxID=189622 RepID=A0A2H6KHA5_9APIC|nr:Chromosome complete related, putative [Babesia ovata]GBE62372.1 Chromosome complete related, putative [Babesia ovata]
MGDLTERQVEEELSRVVYKLRYRTKWKVLTIRGRTTHGNGLQWCYVVNQNVLPVKTALQSVKVDQLYCKVAFDGPIDLRSLLRRGLAAKQHITSMSNACVRLQVDLPQPPGKSTNSAEPEPTTSVWDAGLELERELEAELAHIGRQDKRFATCIVYHSGKAAILGCCNRDEVRFAFDALATLL